MTSKNGGKGTVKNRYVIPLPLVNGTGNSPSPGRPTPGVVKQDKSSGGSVNTTKTRSDPQRVRMSSGERPIGAAKGKQSDTEALCQPPHFLPLWKLFLHFPSGSIEDFPFLPRLAPYHPTFPDSKILVWWVGQFCGGQCRCLHLAASLFGLRVSNQEKSAVFHHR